jgi:hypothetical protein
MAVSSKNLARAGIMNSYAQVFSDVDGNTSAARPTLTKKRVDLNNLPPVFPNSV